MEELMETMVETLTGDPVRLAITISALSLVLMNFMWWATTKKHDRNVEQHFGSMIGVVAVAVLIVFGIDRVQHMGDASADTADKVPQKMIAIEASIAKKTAPQKQPEKQFRAPEPEQPKQGVAKDPDKPPPPKNEKDKPKPPKRNPDDPKPTKPPDRTDSLDKPVGAVKDPAGPPSDNKRGFASVTKGDPFFQALAADINENFEYPRALSTERLANGCFYFNLNGTVAGWKLLPKSGEDQLDDAVERTLKKVEKLRNANPVAVPEHLQEQATTSWTCFSLGNLKRED